jgi:hypothetical protein
MWDDASEFDAEKDKACFRQYEDACDRVKNFYKEQHGMGLCLNVLRSHLNTACVATVEKQTVAFNIQARVNFKSRRRARMGIWQAMEMLDTLVDESDPDVSFHVTRSKWRTPPLILFHSRRACHRLNICSRPPRPFDAMGNPSGCK